ncbi:LytR/AlgR family response regulator transcription factor [Dinghuibacter silviterrae]|uniref:LytTR family two component transcriptional regulator n=1 Tax=Dinghuibacter silviterrae TaxID=1539049 RepID=A0A4R8DNH0_9BACT|nr:LytTR family DNA-binding domain-containing protein [Dinghuibacter silviterrae]TDW99247.1 LytTR family two component transcriptional regulator [Dinghuibacter silviterrae]
MNLTCVVIDDEPVARKVLKEFIADVAFLELVGEAEDPLQALPLAGQVDVLFLDINMPKINGMDFIRGLSPGPSLIMTTAYPAHAAEAYGLNVLDYLVKPIAFERFLKACNKALEWKTLHAGSGPQDHFFVKCNSQIEKVLYDDLVYAEAMMNYVMLYTTARKMLVYVTMKALEEQLPAERFIKVHKSFIVNRDKIKSIDGHVLDMGSARIAISQSLREKVIQEIVRDRMLRR